MHKTGGAFPRFQRTRALLLVAIAVILLSACSGDSSSQAEESDADSNGETTSVPSSSAEITTAPTSTPQPTEVPEVDPASMLRFCDAAAEVQAINGEFADAIEAEEGLGRWVEQAEVMLANAPVVERERAQFHFDYMTLVDRAGSELNYDPMAMETEAFIQGILRQIEFGDERDDNPLQYVQEIDQLFAYVNQEC